MHSCCLLYWLLQLWGYSSPNELSTKASQHDFSTIDQDTYVIVWWLLHDVHSACMVSPVVILLVELMGRDCVAATNIVQLQNYVRLQRNINCYLIAY